MKTASEIQLDALADSYDELCCEFEAIRTQVVQILKLLESNCDKESIANYAKHLLTDINNVIEDRDA